MNDSLILTELLNVKSEIKNFIDELYKFANNTNFNLKNEDEAFFRFISKRIIFFKYILYNKNTYSCKVLISDFFNLIISILENKERYIYLNERSIIEHYIRLILDSPSDKSSRELNLFKNLKESYPYIFNEDIYSLIRNEYSIASEFIHGNEILKNVLVTCFKDFTNNKKSHYNSLNYKNITNLINHFELAFLYSKTSLIDSAFYRKKYILEYLKDKDYVKKLNQLKNI